jgi:cation transport ATPase
MVPNKLTTPAVSIAQASKIEAIIFDKTGTLTVGKPRVTDVVADGLSEDDLLGLAGAAEARKRPPARAGCTG